MKSNFFEDLGRVIDTAVQKQTEKLNKVEGINKDEIELAQKLDAIEEYTIDRFEEDKVVLEDRKTGKMKNIEKDKIPVECKEGDIIKCINGKYFLDIDETEKVEQEIQNRYKNLWE